MLFMQEEKKEEPEPTEEILSNPCRATWQHKVACCTVCAVDSIVEHNPGTKRAGAVHLFSQGRGSLQDA